MREFQPVDRLRADLQGVHTCKRFFFRDLVLLRDKRGKRLAAFPEKPAEFHE